MSASNSRLAYADCYDLMEQAISDPKGIRVQFSTQEEAVGFRQRIHYARKLHREDNAETYEVGHAMHGHSEFDALIARIKVDEDGLWWLYLERQVVARVVESLSEGAEDA